MIDRENTDLALTATTAEQGFGTQSLGKVSETATTAMAAAAQAQVNARFIMALQRPRSWSQVRQRILDECKRPGFAEVARYHKPIGKGVEGPSIRFAEAALRAMTNVLPENIVVFDDRAKRIIRVTVTDLESNLTFSQEVVIEKTVERSSVKDGQVIISERLNSYGKKTYAVEATEDDLLNKQNAIVSKALRTLALRLLPGDILDEAMDIVIETVKTKDAKDPGAAKKSLADGFGRLGIPISQIEEYLGHSFDVVTPDEMMELRSLGLAIKDGETRWSEAIDNRKKAVAGDEAAVGKVEGLKDRVKRQAEAAKAPATPPAQASAEPHATTTTPFTKKEEPKGKKEEREPGQEG